MNTGWLERQFIGTPYVSHTLEGVEEMMTINLDAGSIVLRFLWRQVFCVSD